MTNRAPWGVLMTLLVVLMSADVSATPQTSDAHTKLQAAFPDTCHFSGQFHQSKAMPGLPVPLKSRGDFFFSCDLGLIWHTQAPFSETILYVNNSANYRVDESGAMSPLSGVVRYIMSSVVVRLLNGDTAYFLEAFAVSLEENDALTLIPTSDYMKKGLKHIVLNTARDDKQTKALTLSVTDANGQTTEVRIDDMAEHAITGKREAFARCEALYANNREWCRVLRSPTRVSSL